MAEQTPKPAAPKAKKTRVSYESMVRLTRMYLTTKLEIFRGFPEQNEVVKAQIAELQTILDKLTEAK